MKCDEFREAGREIARRQLTEVEQVTVERHLAECAQCRRWLAAELALDSAFREMAADPVEPPHVGTQTMVMAAFRREAAARAKRRWLAWSIPAAAAAMLAVGVWIRQAPKPEPAPVAVSEEVSPFIPVRYGAPVRPYETLQVMRVDVPRAELVQLGLDMAVDGRGGRVKADVLLGEDGLVKGIRFVYGMTERKGDRR